MALTKINSSVIANNTIAVGNIADNSVDATKIASNSILTRHIDDNQIGIDQLNVSDGSNGQMLTTNGSGTLSFSTPSSFDADAAQVFNESGNDVDFRVESNNNADMLFVDGGNDNVLLGTQNQGHVRLNQQLGLAVTGNVYGGISMVTHSSSAGGNRSLLDFNRSRNTTIGSHTVVNSGDSLGTIVGRGDDGDEFLDAASIDFEVDGTPGDGDMPGRIVFATTADGAGSVTERHRISNGGKASWSAGGIGTVATQSRDFTFYTEGSTNGVDIRSNDYQIAFIGGLASSGAGMDKGYMQLCVDGSAKIAFNTDGNSFFNGGNVGIGTDSPSAKVHLYDSGSTNINLGIQNSTRYYKFEVDSGNLVFFDVSAYAERMRITSSGQVLVGVTSATSMSGAGIETAGSIRANNYITSTDLAGSGFRNVNTTASGSLTTSTSLRELKENIVTTSLGLDAVKALTPREFDWKDVAEYGTEDIGFIADEVFAVSPKLATYKVGEKTEANLQGVKYEQLTAVLVKAIQEQQTIIEDLKARIETLEG